MANTPAPTPSPTPTVMDDLTESYISGVGSGGTTGQSAAAAPVYVDRGNDNGDPRRGPGSGGGGGVGAGAGNRGPNEVAAPIPYNLNPDDPANDVNAILKSLPPEKVAAVQRAMIRAGLLPPDYRVTGFVDQATRSGFGELLQTANDRIGQAGTPNVRERWDNLLDLMAVEGPNAAQDFRVDAARRRAEVLDQTRPVDRLYTQANDLSLNGQAEAGFQAVLGRKPTAKELETFRSAYNSVDRSAQSANFDFDDRQRAAARTSGLQNLGADEAAAAMGATGTGSESDMLWAAVNQMIADSPYADSVTPGARERTYAQQVANWNAYQNGTGPLAARPGTSKHGDGRANDIQGINSDPKIRQWFHENAARYGLHFPLYDPSKPRDKNEAWHVELMGGKGGPTAIPPRVGTAQVTGTVVQAPGASEYAADFARRENPVEAGAVDISKQFESFVEIMSRSVV